MKHALQAWLADQANIQIAINDIDFNPFLGRFSLRSLQLDGTNGQQSIMSSFVMDLAWLPLLKGRIHAQEIILTNGYINLALSQNGLQVAGMPMAIGNSDHSGKTNWPLGVDRLRLENIAVGYRVDSGPKEVLVNKVVLKGFVPWGEQDKGTVVLEASMADGRVDFNGTCSWNSQEVTVDGVLAEADFPLPALAPLFPAQITEIRGAVSGKQQLSFTAPLPLNEGENLLTLKGEVRGEDLFFTGYDHDVSGSVGISSDVAIKLGMVDQLMQADVKISGDSRFENIRVYDRSQKRIRLAMASMAIEGLLAQEPRVRVDAVTIKKLRLFQRLQRKGQPEEGEKFIVFSPEVAIEGLNKDEQGLLQVAHVQAKDTQWFLERDENKEYPLGHWLKTASATSETTATNPYLTAVRVEKFSLLGNNRLEFEDRSPQLVFRETLQPFTLQVGAVDSRQKDLAASLSFQASSGKYASLELNGTWVPLAEKPTMAVSARLESVRLPTFNPYIRQYYDYSFNSGNIDADIDLQVNQGMLESQLQLFIQKVAYVRLSDGTVSRTKKITGMPLDYMVDLLRDKKNNIRLSLEVRGDLNNPRFDYTDALLQAASAAAKKTAVSYFAPLGVSMLTGVSLPVGTLYVAGKVAKWVTTMRFDPVLFEPQKEALSQDARRHLDTLATLLLEKPGLEIVLCGKATVRESGAEPVRENVTTTEQKEFLAGLAYARAEAVKAYLVDKGVAARQLVVCDAAIETDPEAQPRVEMAL